MYQALNTYIVTSRTPKLALLLCDRPIPAVLDAYGDYERIFYTLFNSSLPTSVKDFSMDAFDVRWKMEYPPEEELNNYDGIVMTGSGALYAPLSQTAISHLIVAASAYEDVEWINKLVSWIANVVSTKPQIKIIGEYSACIPFDTNRGPLFRDMFRTSDCCQGSGRILRTERW